MSFRLKHRHSIGNELGGLVRKEFKSALAELDGGRPDEEAIHEARKSVKKIRAELRLLHDDLGSEYDKANRRLRVAAHSLSSLRDVDVVMETMRDLKHHYPALITPPVERAVLDGLRRREREVKAHAAPLIGRAIGALRRSRKRLARDIRRAGGVGAVRRGLDRGYRRARDLARAVGMDSGTAQFHLWRRRVKDHWYHVRLFQNLHPTARTRVRTLERLDEWLGDEHNLGVLRSIVLEEPARFGGARTTAVVLGCILRRQQSLRRRAVKLGHRIFSVKPNHFARSAAAWW